MKRENEVENSVPVTDNKRHTRNENCCHVLYLTLARVVITAYEPCWSFMPVMEVGNPGGTKWSADSLIQQVFGRNFSAFRGKEGFGTYMPFESEKSLHWFLKYDLQTIHPILFLNSEAVRFHTDLFPPITELRCSLLVAVLGDSLNVALLKRWDRLDEGQAAVGVWFHRHYFSEKARCIAKRTPHAVIHRNGRWILTGFEIKRRHHWF